MSMVSIHGKPIVGRLYCVEYQDGAVKIGCSTQVAERLYALQGWYRGRPSRIDRVYVGEITPDMAWAEQAATFDLPRRTWKEIYDVSFSQAVRRIKKAVPDRHPFVLYNREEVIHEFPFLRRYEFDH